MKSTQGRKATRPGMALYTLAHIRAHFPGLCRQKREPVLFVLSACCERGREGLSYQSVIYVAMERVVVLTTLVDALMASFPGRRRPRVGGGNAAGFAKTRGVRSWSRDGPSRHWPDLG
jgi:hypothetical protein